MSLETAALRATGDIVDKGTKLVDTAFKKVWSIMDAASEKESPTQMLSPQAINSMQGKIYS